MWVWYPRRERRTVASMQGRARLARVAQDPSKKEENQAKISQGESRNHISGCGAKGERKSKKGYAGWCVWRVSSARRCIWTPIRDVWSPSWTTARASKSRRRSRRVGVGVKDSFVRLREPHLFVVIPTIPVRLWTSCVMFHPTRRTFLHNVRDRYWAPKHAIQVFWGSAGMLWPDKE